MEDGTDTRLGILEKGEEGGGGLAARDVDQRAVEPQHHHPGPGAAGGPCNHSKHRGVFKSHLALGLRL